MADWDLDTAPRKKPGAAEGRTTGAPDARLSDAAAGLPAEPWIQVPAQVADAPASATGIAAPDGATHVLKPRRRKTLRLLRWIGAALLLLIAGALIGFFLARSQLAGDSAELIAAQDKLPLVEKALTAAEERNWLYYRETEALKVELEQARASGSTPTTVPGSGVAGTYADGVYVVGEDISPGTYDGVVTGEMGYWARLKGTDGIVASIITNALPRGPFELTIIESDKAVELRGVVITAR